MTVDQRPDDARHIPVLRDEVIAALNPQAGDMHVDGTFGAGGYTRAILARGATVFAIDRDPDAIRDGAPLVAEAKGALMLRAGRYADMRALLAQDGIDAVDGVTVDIGVSSMQIDQGSRGFSFSEDGPLDMRMEQSGQSAADWINSADDDAIADILFHYGEERQSRRVARAIVAARPIERTGQLAAVVRRALGYRPHDKKDPATRSFQAIRIHINDELGELERGLQAAEQVLRPGGRIAVVTFHSLEDRIVKQFLNTRSGAGSAGSRHLPPKAEHGPAPTFEAVAKPRRASDVEIARNPRARSATLRAAVRTSAPAWTNREARP